MKKSAIALGSVGMALLVMACSGGSDTPAPFTTAESDGLVKLSELTGATWKSDQGVAGSVALYFASGPGKPVLPNAARSPNDVLALLAPLAQELGIQGGLESELHDGEILSDVSDEEPGVYRFRQHAPLPVATCPSSTPISSSLSLPKGTCATCRPRTRADSRPSVRSPR